MYGLQEEKMIIKYLSDFLDRLENQIETYDGENWIDRYAE